jgi:hypothetical protein
MRQTSQNECKNVLRVPKFIHTHLSALYIHAKQNLKLNLLRDVLCEGFNIFYPYMYNRLSDGHVCLLYLRVLPYVSCHISGAQSFASMAI